MIPSDYYIGINQQESLQIELSEIYRPVPGSCHVLFTRVGGNCFHTETILSCTPFYEANILFLHLMAVPPFFLTPPTPPPYSLIRLFSLFKDRARASIGEVELSFVITFITATGH